MHYIQPSIGVGFKILVRAPLFCPLDVKLKGELLWVQHGVTFVDEYAYISTSDEVDIILFRSPLFLLPLDLIFNLVGIDLSWAFTTNRDPVLKQSEGELVATGTIFSLAMEEEIIALCL